jgi:hypothetical protein
MTTRRRPYAPAPSHKAGRSGRRIVPDPREEPGGGWLLALVIAGLLLHLLVTR